MFGDRSVRAPSRRVRNIRPKNAKKDDRGSLHCRQNHKSADISASWPHSFPPKVIASRYSRSPDSTSSYAPVFPGYPSDLEGARPFYSSGGCHGSSPCSLLNGACHMACTVLHRYQHYSISFQIVPFHPAFVNTYCQKPTKKFSPAEGLDPRPHMFSASKSAHIPHLPGYAPVRPLTDQDPGIRFSPGSAMRKRAQRPCPSFYPMLRPLLTGHAPREPGHKVCAASGDAAFKSHTAHRE